MMKNPYKPLNDSFIPRLGIEKDLNYDFRAPGLYGHTEKDPIKMSRKETPHFASLLNVTTEVHQVVREQAMNYVTIPLALFSFIIGLIACHTYLGVSLMAGATAAMGITILVSSVTLNTFVNTHFMLKNFESIWEEAWIKLAGVYLNLVNDDMLDLAPKQGGALERTVKFLLWTFGCIGLTVGAVYPFYSVDKTTADELPEWVAKWFRDAMDAIPQKSLIVGFAFGGLLYQPINEMASQIVNNLNYYGRKGINFVMSPFGVEVQVEKPPFKITRQHMQRDIRQQAKDELQELAPKIKALKQAAIATVETKRQYYLGLIQSGRNIDSTTGKDPVLEALYAAINPKGTPDYQDTLNMLYTYNTLYAGKESEMTQAHPDDTPWWQTLIGIFHNPLGWIALAGYVNKAVAVAGATWLGILVSAPLLILIGYMVAQPLIIKIVEYIKNIAKVVAKAWRGEKIKEDGESMKQFLARLLPMPLHMIQNPKKMMFIMAISLLMGFFSCYVASLLNLQLFGDSVFWPAIEFVTFYMTILFNVNPVDKVCGSLFRFFAKHFGSDEEAERTRNEIRIDEFADKHIKMINQMDDVKFYKAIREIVENQAMKFDPPAPGVTVVPLQKGELTAAQKTDTVRSETLAAFFGRTDLNEYLHQTDEAADAEHHNLHILQSLNSEFDAVKLKAQGPKHHEGKSPEIPYVEGEGYVMI